MAEHLHNTPGVKAKTLFATHYHELTQLHKSLPGVRNFNVAVKEWDENIVFLHRIVPGGADKSYGIHVANKGLGAVPGKPWLTWLGNIGRVFAGLFWQGEGHLRHNLPGRPYLDAIQAVLFLLGLGWLGRRGEGETRRQGEWLSDQALLV